jgi:CRP-like cAMP-binding protein
MHANQHGINIEALLAHVPLFNELATEEIARLARGTREIKAARGDILFHKGDTPTGFYLIVYGQVKLAFTSPQWRRKSRRHHRARSDLRRGRDVHGQAVHGLCAGAGRLAAAAHLEDGDSRRTRRGPEARSQDDCRAVDASAPPDQRRGIVFAVFGPAANHWLICYWTGPGNGGKGITVTLPTNKGVIASRLNLTQEHFSRILHELSEKGLIVVEGRRIHIPDVEKLRMHDS